MKKLVILFCAASTVLGVSAQAQSVDGAAPYCREYTQMVTVGARQQEGYGTACLQPDGAWQIVKPASVDNEAPMVMANNTIIQPEYIPVAQPVYVQEPESSFQLFIGGDNHRHYGRRDWRNHGRHHHYDRHDRSRGHRW